MHRTASHTTAVWPSVKAWGSRVKQGSSKYVGLFVKGDEGNRGSRVKQGSRKCVGGNCVRYRHASI